MTRDDALHPLLARQLRRAGIGGHDALPTSAQWKLLLERVGRAYHDADQDRYLLERSQELASAEMQELYRALAGEKAQLETRVHERTKSLEASEAHLAEAQRIARLGSWSYVPHSGRSEWSDECFRLLGLDPARGTPAAADVLGLVHPDDRERVRAALRDAYRSGTNGDTEFRVQRGDGETLWLHALLETFADDDGRAVLLRGTLRDITRQKHAEAERDRALQRLNIALHGSDLVLVDVDPDGVVYLSERWNVLLGGEPKETHTTFDALMALTREDERESILRQYVDALTGRSREYNIEHRVRGYDGRWRWIRCRGRVVERDAHGRARRLAGINEDITARKESEERLRQSESRFRSLLAMSSDWYWEQDAELRFVEIGSVVVRDAGGARTPVPPYVGKRRWELPDLIADAEAHREARFGAVAVRRVAVEAAQRARRDPKEGHRHADEAPLALHRVEDLDQRRLGAGSRGPLIASVGLLQIAQRALQVHRRGLRVRRTAERGRSARRCRAATPRRRRRTRCGSACREPRTTCRARSRGAAAARPAGTQPDHTGCPPHSSATAGTRRTTPPVRAGHTPGAATA